MCSLQRGSDSQCKVRASNLFRSISEGLVGVKVHPLDFLVGFPPLEESEHEKERERGGEGVEGFSFHPPEKKRAMTA